MNSTPNSKLIARFLFTVLFFGLGIWFIRHEKAELTEVRSALFTAQWLWVIAGIAISALYVFLQGLLYVTCFSTIKCKVSLKDTIDLFLKRNFISVFLPAGGVSSLAFFTGTLEKKAISKTQIHYASTIYAFTGIISVIFVAVPALLYAFTIGKTSKNEWLAFFVLLIFMAIIAIFLVSMVRKGWLFKAIMRYFPAFVITFEDLMQNKILIKKVILAVWVSVLIEFTGIAHVFIAMKALHADPSILAAMLAYIISVIFLIISPFLRGLGAVEISMSIILVRFGFSNIAAISVTLLYRFFEFWLPLVTGLFSFLSRLNKLLVRVIPALMLLLLGIINIVSVMTPAISWRLEKLQEYIMIDAIHASNFFVLMAGFFLLVTAAFMMKGLRSAWWMALILSLVSFVGHITKAIDYEEASIALLNVVLLVYTHKEYYIRNNPHLQFVGFQTALISIGVTMLYGIAGFYFIHQKHFNIDFSFVESIRYTLSNYILIGNANLVPLDNFGHDFILSINAGGFLSMSFLLYTLVRPYVYKDVPTATERSRASDLLVKFGKSALDHFKMAEDKMLFCPTALDAFISYRITGNFAVVLEDPVARDEFCLRECIRQFDLFCYENSLKSIYYRVPEPSLGFYAKNKKKSMFIGQEAVVNLDTFSLEGNSKKSLRNAINKIKEKGYKSNIHLPPVKDGVIQKIKSVSDEWLMYTGRKEIIFSQGSFNWNELKSQTIITVESNEEKIIAFLNIIPDYAPYEGTYDLLRKTADAPNGIMDFILIELINYFKVQHIRFLNLGFAPMSGWRGDSFREKSMKFVYEKIRSFSQFKGMREYKDKFDPAWYNKYLIYDNDYDLVQVPSVLSRVIKKG
jgi:phosphatidylglycerol lysyltransferase